MQERRHTRTAFGPEQVGQRNTIRPLALPSRLWTEAALVSSAPARAKRRPKLSPRALPLDVARQSPRHADQREAVRERLSRDISETLEVARRSLAERVDAVERLTRESAEGLRAQAAWRLRSRRLVWSCAWPGSQDHTP